ncbi:hypothetical protein [Microbacterium lushaniae]|nr:hypothetical protein [Microbacterium lushaniae]
MSADLAAQIGPDLIDQAGALLNNGPVRLRGAARSGSEKGLRSARVDA